VPDLTSVDHDPFQPIFTPVDHDPFGALQSYVAPQDPNAGMSHPVGGPGVPQNLRDRLETTLNNPDVPDWQKAAATISAIPLVLSTNLAKSAWSGLTLPGDVAAGRTDLGTPEGFGRVQDLAGLVMTGGMPMAERGALGTSGGRMLTPVEHNPFASEPVLPPIEADPLARNWESTHPVTPVPQNTGWRELLRRDGTGAESAADLARSVINPNDYLPHVQPTMNLEDIESPVVRKIIRNSREQQGEERAINDRYWAAPINPENMDAETIAELRYHGYNIVNSDSPSGNSLVWKQLGDEPVLPPIEANPFASEPGLPREDKDFWIHGPSEQERSKYTPSESMTMDQIARRQSIMDHLEVGQDHPLVENVGSALDKANIGLEDFKTKMFGHPDISLRQGFNGELALSGNVLDENGAKIGDMIRSIDFQNGQVHHNLLDLGENVQGNDVGKNLLKSQVDLYNKMGLNSVHLNANIDIGSYAWARYGFEPENAREWGKIQRFGHTRLSDYFEQQLPQDIVDQARNLLNSKDPRAVYILANLRTPVNIRWEDMGEIKNPTLGKGLLIHSAWQGKLDLTNPEQMARFNSYVGTNK
jgi:hypothetical protein